MLRRSHSLPASYGDRSIHGLQRNRKARTFVRASPCFDEKRWSGNGLGGRGRYVEGRGLVGVIHEKGQIENLVQCLIQ